MRLQCLGINFIELYSLLERPHVECCALADDNSGSEEAFLARKSRKFSLIFVHFVS